MMWVCGASCRLCIVWLLLLLIIPSSDGERIWKCSGKPTTYTYTDCETDRSVRDGCYYLVHFEQYRPCNDICDGIEMWSIDEERCRSLCPAYLTSYCRQHDPTETTQTSSTTQLPTTSLQFHPPTTQSSQKETVSGLKIIVAVLAATLALILITLTAVLIRRGRKGREHHIESPINVTTRPLQSTDKDEFDIINDYLPTSNEQDEPKEALMDTNEKKLQIVYS